MIDPAPPLRVLSVLSSSNQMYSGIGRAVFELTERLSGRCRYEFAIDDLNARNVARVSDFAASRGIPVHVGRGRHGPDTLDNVNDDLPDLLRQRRWDVVECVCFANTGTNLAQLDALDAEVLAYTPHDQPTWTVPMSPAQADRLEGVHRRVLDRADVVFCDSPRERQELQALIPGRCTCTHIPLGCDFAAFRPGRTKRAPQLLFVGDLAEPRKRFDRVLAVFARLIRARPQSRLVVIGNRSAEAIDLIPRDLRHACDLRGYVSEGELQRAYAESAGLVLFSDFEAFGIPILEALACGTPAFLSRQAATESLFARFRAAHFCPADDPDATASTLIRELDRGPSALAEALADLPRLRETFDWDRLAARKWQAMAAAWAVRNAWAMSA